MPISPPDPDQQKTSPESLSPLQRYLAKSQAPPSVASRERVGNQSSLADHGSEGSAGGASDRRPRFGLNSEYLMWFFEKTSLDLKRWWQKTQADARRARTSANATPTSPGPSFATTSGSVFEPPTSPRLRSALDFPHAGFSVRAGAFLVDAVVIMALRYFIRNYVLQPSADMISDFWLMNLIVLPYFAWFYSRRGASIGKMVMGLQVVDARTGRFLSPAKAVFREMIGKYLSFLLFGMGFLAAAFRADHKALHDLIFETVVVRVPPVQKEF